MKNDFNTNKLIFGFVGLGLIGGSMAKALRSTYKDCTIIAYNRSEGPRQMALNDGVADIVTDTVDIHFIECDFIFLCTPVEFNETYFEILSKIIKPNCILTDVGSVKGNIHKAAKAFGLEKNFIGGHPMAGSEKTGYEYSSASICKDAVYPITTFKDTDKAFLDKYIKILTDIGFKPIVMTYEDHDYAAAAISHIPHIAAAQLALLAKNNEDENEYMKKLASSGFKDTTRIAASSADVWEQICISNSENISRLLDQYISSLTKIKESIATKDRDSVHNMFIESKKYRDLY